MKVTAEQPFWMHVGRMCEFSSLFRLLAGVAFEIESNV